MSLARSFTHTHTHSFVFLSLTHSVDNKTVIGNPGLPENPEALDLQNFFQAIVADVDVSIIINYIGVL